MKFATYFFLFTLFLVSFTSCQKDDNQTSPNNIFVALPSPPVMVKNTTGTWLVYEMHIKTPILDNVRILYDNQELMNYTDFIKRDDMNIASIWLEFPEGGWELQEIAHEFYYKTDGSGTAQKHLFNLEVNAQYPEAKTIQFPVPQGVWLAEGAAGPNSYHTRALFPYETPRYDESQGGYLFGNNPQRYAIDYALLQDGLPFVNDGSNLNDWFCYNLPILAAQGGKVIFTEDGIPDNMTPGKLDYETDMTNATGNVVYIEHEDGTIGTYCHMIPNSIVVEVGDIVEAGQILGRLGNSGNSFAPHLHMHVMTNPDGKTITQYSDGLFMESLPYRFSTFTKLGALPPGHLDERPIVPFEPTMSEEFQNVLPSESDVISF